MDIDIQVKGGVELSKFYPEEYEKFEEKISNLVMDTFPGVDGCWVGSELTDQHRKEAARRQDRRDQEFKTALVNVLKEPEFQDIIQSRLAALTGN